MPLWVPLLTAALGSGVTVLIFILNGKRDRAKSHREASNSFRLAFSEALTQIGRTDAHSLMHRSRVQHDVAILVFRGYIKLGQRAGYDAAAEVFRARRDAVPPASLIALTAIGSGMPVDNSETIELADAINKLLAYASLT